MPRISGVSSFSTTWLSLRRPSALAVAFWRLLKPMVLLASLIWMVLAMTLLPMPEGCNLARVNPAMLRFHPIVLQLLQRHKRSLHHIKNIAAAQRLAQNIVDAAGFDHRPYTSAG